MKLLLTFLFSIAAAWAATSTPVTINSVTVSGGVATVSCGASNCKVNANYGFCIAGVSDATLNVCATALTGTAGTSFTFATTASNESLGAAGTVITAREIIFLDEATSGNQVSLTYLLWLTTTNGVPDLTVHRVVLRRQGQQGTWVPGSTVINGNNNGSFNFTDDWTDGVLLPSPLTVITTNNTNFVNLSGLSALSGNNPIPLRVVGLVLVNPATGQPVFVARRVEELTAE